MADTLTCPVCHFANIPEDSDTCPQCDSDLVCFRLLDALPVAPRGDEPPVLPKPSGQNITESANRPKQYIRIPARSAYAGLACLLILGLAFGYAAGNRFAVLEGAMKEVQSRLTGITAMMGDNRTAIRETSRAVQELGQTSAIVLKTVNHLQKTAETRVEKTADPAHAESAPAPPDTSFAASPCFKQYQAKDTDTLWGISRVLYGSGFFYPVLLEHNSDLAIHNISRRDTLRYLCDPKAVPEICQEITAVRHGKRYWKYKIRPGETRRAVVRRYCSKNTDCLVEGTPFKAGMTIGIYLE